LHDVVISIPLPCVISISKTPHNANFLSRLLDLDLIQQFLRTQESGVSTALVMRLIGTSAGSILTNDQVHSNSLLVGTTLGRSSRCRYHLLHKEVLLVCGLLR
jgi:hypothetical protein